MYGMFNEAMRRLVPESSGNAAWAEIAERADVPETFAAMSSYDDDVTCALAGVAGDVLGAPEPAPLPAGVEHLSAASAQQRYDVVRRTLER